MAWGQNRHSGTEPSAARLSALRGPAYWKIVPQEDEYEDYDDELYEKEGVLYIDDLDPITFCAECAPPSGDFIPLANSPRVGIDCFDNTHSWRTWPLPEYDGR